MLNDIFHNALYSKNEIFYSLKVVWFVFTLFFFLVLLLPFVINDEFMYKAIPVCEWKEKYGTSCITCGMTHSFYSISNGNFQEALFHNKYSVFLYLFIVFNNIFFIYYFLKKQF
jgi:hypothetical protein